MRRCVQEIQFHCRQTLKSFKKFLSKNILKTPNDSFNSKITTYLFHHYLEALWYSVQTDLTQS